MKGLSLPQNILYLVCLYTLSTTCYALDNKYTKEKCVNLASKNLEVVDNIINNKRSTNKEWRLDKTAHEYYDCGFSIKDESLQQLFIGAGGNVLLISGSVSEIGNIKFEMVIENLYIELTHAVDQIEKTTQKQTRSKQ